MSQTVTITPEELKELQEVKTSIYETISIIGDLNHRKMLLDLELDAIKETVKANALKERSLLKEFGQKYGDGSINLETGQVTSL